MGPSKLVSRTYFYVTNDPANGKAAKLYVKQADLEYVRFGEIYTEQKVDNFTISAKKKYKAGSKDNVNMIYQANKHVIGKDKDLIKPGQKLLIPYIGPLTGAGQMKLIRGIIKQRPF